MPRLLKTRAKKKGLPPGTLVHIGEKRAQGSSITIIDYNEANISELEVKTLDQCFPFKESPTTTWINVEGLDADVIQKLGDCYGFHHLVLEDILNTDQRPKLEDYGEYLYIVVKMIAERKGRKEVEFFSEQISIILGKNFVISFQEGLKGDVFNSIRERIRSGKGRVRSMGADYLAYSLMDAIVDNYFVILEAVGERIEDIEDELVSHPAPATLKSIHELKGEMIYLRKAVWPLREVISGLERGGSPLVRQATTLYLRDVYDHTVQVIDVIETSREMLSGMLDIYISSLSNRLNEIMKFLTIIGTIFIPLTFVVGVYGMNFDIMPELHWRYGYLLVISGMFLVSVSMLFYFRRKKWI